MTIRIGRWDCPACGHIGVLGPETHCLNCGSSRPEDVQFYLPDDEDAVKQKEKIKEAYSGADWVCSHCAGHNKAVEGQCSQCGSFRDDPGDGDKELEERIIYHEEEERSPVAISKPKRNFRGLYRFLGFLVFILFIATCNKKIDVEVKDHSWEREIAVEVYREITEQGWKVPSGGREIRNFRDIHHYNRVFDGYETRTRTIQEKVGTEEYVCGNKDMGNGYFQDIYCSRDVYESREETYQEKVYHEEPVYRTKYEYRIWKWLPDEAIKSSGFGKNRQWPSLQKDPEFYRTGAKKEKIKLILTDKEGNEYIEEVPEHFWIKTKKGAQLKAKKARFGGSFRGLIYEE